MCSAAVRCGVTGALGQITSASRSESEEMNVGVSCAMVDGGDRGGAKRLGPLALVVRRGRLWSVEAKKMKKKRNGGKQRST
nr:hypothetical protein Iba_chr04eCG14580 [Ipomoea batatas]